MNSLLWRLYAAVGVAMASAYPLLPAGAASDGLYAFVGSSCVVAIAVGMRLHRPTRPMAWRLMLIGQLLWVIGDAVDSWQADVLHLDVFPSLVDVFYLAAYPVLAVALVLLVRGRRPRRDVAGLLDSATVTAGLGLLSWVVLAHPTYLASQYSLAAAVVAPAYPVGDILLVGMLIRLVMTPGGRTPAFRLLLTAVLLLVAGDTASSALSLWSVSSQNYDVIWLVSYVAWGAAALHPSMASMSQPGRSDDLRFTRPRLVALALASMVAPGILTIQHLTGSPVDVWAIATGSVVLFGLVVGRMNVAIVQIVSAQRERERMRTDLEYQASHDALTALPNRAQALESITSALSRAQRRGYFLGLLFVDLDGFKAVNDNYGHMAGDAVLRAVAQRLSSGVRSGDMVARLGGDEFVVLLEGIDAESDAVEIASRIVEVVTEPITLDDGQLVRVGASVGLAISQDGFTDADQLLHEADTAVYRAKASGRGRVEVFDDALRSELAKRAELEGALKHAIEHDELVVHYQPIIDLAGGAVTGYEALVRWQRPGYGLLSPDAFIPVAEASSLICDLDTWVLRHATCQLATWLGESSTPLTMAVNISGRHISSPRIVDDVRGSLATSGLPAESLVLEITETVLIEDLRALDHLEQLRGLGVAISIDDFGTGYSSIAGLRYLPVDSVKIDRTFLDTSQRSSLALLELMIRSAHAFELPVVVEGVEHQHQLETLRALNCDSAQGYFFARPAPADETPHAVPTDPSRTQPVPAQIPL